MDQTSTLSAESMAATLSDFIAQGVAALGGHTDTIDPGHREAFHWPPHAISHDFKIDSTAFLDRRDISIRGENLRVHIAHTDHGVFGRIEDLWNEARGESIEEVEEQLVASAEPWFDRMDAITNTLGRKERYHGTLNDLDPMELVKLLYCPDRDVAHHAMVEIEKHASTGLFLPSLVTILNDDQHPYRRIAQWCVLDMLEDSSAFCKSSEEGDEVVGAIRNLIWRATDDYARAVFKAGVVLGGHICTPKAGDVLVECFRAPHKIGRRSAYHAVFHYVEWVPESRERIVSELRTAAEVEQVAQLKEFALNMANDIANEDADHIPEPVFPEEIK
ncbi:MAG: hypothetical protein R2688_02510 [Fimbriimonadaceae bacterium]